MPPLRQFAVTSPLLTCMTARKYWYVTASISRHSVRRSCDSRSTFLRDDMRGLISISLVVGRAGGQDRPTTTKEGSMRQFRALSGAALVALLVACGGGSDPAAGGGPPPPPGGLPPPASAPALKTNLAARYGVVNFPVGAAIEPASTTNADRDVLLKHFSSITAENVMKPATVWPNAPGTSGSTAQPATQPDFVSADTLADFALNNGIQLRGHTLLWHQSAPDWFFAGDQQQPGQLPHQCAAAAAHLHLRRGSALSRHLRLGRGQRSGHRRAEPCDPYRTNSPWYIAYSVGGQDGIRVRARRLHVRRTRRAPPSAAPAPR